MSTIPLAHLTTQDGHELRIVGRTLDQSLDAPAAILELKAMGDWHYVEHVLAFSGPVRQIVQALVDHIAETVNERRDEDMS